MPESEESLVQIRSIGDKHYTKYNWDCYKKVVVVWRGADAIEVKAAWYCSFQFAIYIVWFRSVSGNIHKVTSVYYISPH